MDKFFHITERGSTVKREVLAGIVTFLAMSYILFVNPTTLADAGMDPEVVFVTTALAAAIATLIMGLYANYPVALAPGMGMNAFFTYTIVIGQGYSWEQALFGVFVSGLCFLALSLTGLREKIINAIPTVIKSATTVGIGMFIAFIGFQNAAIIINSDATLVTLGDFLNPITLLSVIGVLLMFALIIKKNNYAIFISMVILTIAGILLVAVTNIDLGISYTGIVSIPPSIAPTFGKIFTAVEPMELLTDLSFWVLVLSLLFVDFFDTTGTLIAVGEDAGFTDEDGNLKDGKKALFADALGTTIGAVLGTSSVTSYVESISGVKSGARTGLSAVIVAVCFLLALFFSNLLTIVGVYVTAPVLIVVGTLMAVNNSKINYKDYLEAATAFIIVIFMVLAYSISEGIAAGFIVYTFLSVVSGKKENLSLITYVLTGIFLIHYFI